MKYFIRLGSAYTDEIFHDVPLLCKVNVTTDPVKISKITIIQYPDKRAVRGNSGVSTNYTQLLLL